jgi:ERCC4-type nuclease
MSDQDFILIRYIHPNKGKHKVIGTATRTNYGRRRGGEEFLVHKQDVQAQSHLFIEMQTRRPPEVKRVPTPPPVYPLSESQTLLDEAVEAESEQNGLDFELQLLPGVTPAIEKGLVAEGYDDIQKVHAAGMDGLKSVKGIGEAKAQAIMEYVKRLLAQEA